MNHLNAWWTMQNLSSVNSFFPHRNRDSIKLLKQQHQMTYETLGDIQSIVPLKTFIAVWYVSSDAICLSWRSGIEKALSSSSFIQCFPFCFSSPCLQCSSWAEEKHQIHRSIINKNLQVHMDPQGQHIIGYFFPLFLHLSSSPPSLLGKLEIGVKVCTVAHAARWHCLPVNRQSHRREIKEKREGVIEERDKKNTEKRREGWFRMRGTWRPDNLFCSLPPACRLLNHHLLQREREREEGCSVMQEGGSKRAWKKTVKRGKSL